MGSHGSLDLAAFVITVTCYATLALCHWVRGHRLEAGAYAVVVLVLCVNEAMRTANGGGFSA